jgi:hypothetical protein
MAENLFREPEEVIDDLERNWNILVVAITSDAGGEALNGTQKASTSWSSGILTIAVRRSLLILLPLQNNLIVGDFFRSDAEFLQYTNKATELIG